MLNEGVAVPVNVVDRVGVMLDEELCVAVTEPDGDPEAEPDAEGDDDVSAQARGLATSNSSRIAPRRVRSCTRAMAVSSN